MEKPGIPLSTRKAVTPPRARFSSSVTAMVVNSWAVSALVIKILFPFNTQ
jgi:hypothetical protein